MSLDREKNSFFICGTIKGGHLEGPQWKERKKGRITGGERLGGRFFKSRSRGAGPSVWGVKKRGDPEEKTLGPV